MKAILSFWVLKVLPEAPDFPSPQGSPEVPEKENQPHQQTHAL